MTLTMDAPKTLSDDSVTETQEATAIAGKIGDDQPVAETPPADEPKAAAEEPAEEQDAEDETFWDELELMGELADAERKAQEAEAEHESLKLETKAAKKRCEYAVLDIRRITSEIVDLISGKKLPSKPKDESTEAESEDDNAWRNESTETLLDGLKGLGSKKMDAIIELAPTVGDLEDLRGEASKAHKQFKEKLPDGFGQKLADAIEDRLIEHVAKAGPSAAEQAAAEKTESESGGDDSSERETKDSDEGISEALRSVVDERSKTLAAKKRLGVPKEDFEPDPNETDDMKVVGWKARMGTRPITECPIDNASGQPSHEWVHGWLSADLTINWDQPADGDGQEIIDQDSPPEEYEDVDDSTL